MVHCTQSSHQQLKPVVWPNTVHKLPERGRTAVEWSRSYAGQPASQPAGHRSVDLLFINYSVCSKFGEWSGMAWFAGGEKHSLGYEVT